ncbi:hypothetical protein LCGC14_2154030 [marine sediment metagenome]|uniref:Uncharacterized protein n=1 Tax=marine sediment metagenome TaxID=412755 RepID=A0A0F9EGX3_9ZZZZ
MIYLLAIFLWSFWGADGVWEYNLAQSPEELFQECRMFNGGCATSEQEIWILLINRYMPSSYPCLTVEDHEFAHALGYTHEDMKQLCYEEKLKNPDGKYYSITKNAEHILYWQQRG